MAKETLESKTEGEGSEKKTESSARKAIGAVESSARKAIGAVENFARNKGGAFLQTAIGAGKLYASYELNKHLPGFMTFFPANAYLSLGGGYDILRGFLRFGESDADKFQCFEKYVIENWKHLKCGFSEGLHAYRTSKASEIDEETETPAEVPTETPTKTH